MPRTGTFVVGIPYSTVHAFIAKEVCSTLIGSAGASDNNNVTAVSSNSSAVGPNKERNNDAVSDEKLVVLSVGIVSIFATIAFIGWYTNKSIKVILAEDAAQCQQHQQQEGGVGGGSSREDRGDASCTQSGPIELVMVPNASAPPVVP